MSAPILGRRTRRGGEYACADTNPRASRRVGLVRLRGKRSTDGMELVSAPLLAFAASALRRQRSSARSHFSIRIQPSLHHILRAGEAWRMLAPRSNAARQKIDHLGLRTARTSFPPRPGCAFVRTRTGRIRPLTCKSSADLESALTRPYSVSSELGASDEQQNPYNSGRVQVRDYVQSVRSVSGEDRARTQSDGMTSQKHHAATSNASAKRPHIPTNVGSTVWLLV